MFGVVTCKMWKLRNFSIYYQLYIVEVGISIFIFSATFLYWITGRVKMVWSCTLLAILFIIRVSHGQLQECPSCCHHSFTEDNITAGVAPFRFRNCDEDEEFTILAAKCFSECAYNVSVGMEFSAGCSYRRVNYADLKINCHTITLI